MIDLLQDHPLPLQPDASGVIRVGATRVTLDTVIAAFDAGATAEQIVQDYPVLNLADVYTVLGYYLRHRAELEDYLRRERRESKEIREQIESEVDPSGVRERLLARHQSRALPNVPASDG